MALMAAHGEITPMPKCAIFADTQDEPKSVYTWLDWLENQLPFPVVRVTKGNLMNASLVVKRRKDDTGNWSKTLIPAFIKNADGTSGIIQRQCTHDYKIIPLIRAGLKIMREAGQNSFTQWIGISLDEAHRMKPSRDARITHRWPLIDGRINRHDCLRWMEKHKLPRPPRSACVYCPYHSDREWRRLRVEEPEEFAKAVVFDNDYREARKKCERANGLPYLHRSLVPLGQVDFSTDEDHGQQVMFGNECEGMCGV